MTNQSLYEDELREHEASMQELRSNPRLGYCHLCGTLTKIVGPVGGELCRGCFEYLYEDK